MYKVAFSLCLFDTEAGSTPRKQAENTETQSLNFSVTTVTVICNITVAMTFRETSWNTYIVRLSGINLSLVSEDAGAHTEQPDYEILFVANIIIIITFLTTQK